MAGGIRSIRILQHRLTPMEADVRAVVEVEDLTGAELRGRVHGPMCPGTDTIQVAYPFRALPPSDGPGGQVLAARALIPEPNLWSPETPFVYEAAVELWRDGKRVDSQTQTFGLSLRPTAG
jgi:hypothetical protein